MGIVPSPPAKQLAGEIRLHRATPDGGIDTVDLGRLDPRGPEYRDVRGGEIGMIFQEPMTSFSPLHTVGIRSRGHFAAHSGFDPAVRA